MPYCPRCKTEYRKGAKTCAGCGAPLVENLPGQEEGGETGPEERGVFLAAANGSADVLAIEGNLRAAGIPFRKKGAGGPGAFAPYTFGAEFYVPARYFRRARAELPAGLPEFPKRPGSPEGDDAVDLAAMESEEGAARRRDSSESARRDIEGDAAEPEPGGAPRETGSPLKNALAVVLFFVVVGLLVLGVDFAMNLIRAALRIPG